MHTAKLAAGLLEVVTVIAIVLAVKRPRAVDLLWAVVSLVAAVWWLDVNGPLEGGVLLVFTSAHGLTSGDLLAVPTVAVAVALLLRYGVARDRSPRRPVRSQTAPEDDRALTS